MTSGDIILKIEIIVKGVKYEWQMTPEDSCPCCDLEWACDEYENFPCLDNLAKFGHGFWLFKEDVRED